VTERKPLVTRTDAKADGPGSSLEATDSAAERIVREHFRHVSTSWGTRYARPQQKISDQDLLLRRENVHRLLGPIRDAAAVGARLRILDVGCGTGDVLDGVPRDRVQVIGIDFVLGMVRDAASTHPDDAFVAGNAAAIPLAPRSQDVVVCLGVLEYVPDPAAVLASIRGVLRPGGHLIVSFPNRGSAFRLLSRFESRCERALFGLFHALGGRSRDDNRPRYRHRQWTVGGARHLVVAAGFEVDRIFFNTFGLWGRGGTWGPNLAFSEWMSRRCFAESPVSIFLATTMVVGATRTAADR
jgi:2-polyprenyl-3-methyl-5-hydroxy-6-metoxy-1,4-benzoquinol methylase